MMNQPSKILLETTMVRTGGLHVYRPSKVDLLSETTMVGYMYFYAAFLLLITVLIRFKATL